MNADLLAEISDSVAALPPGPERVETLRRRWPSVHFSHCLEDELGADEPSVEGRDFNLYLVTGAGGCGHLTRDLDQASGLVVADLE